MARSGSPLHLVGGHTSCGPAQFLDPVGLVPRAHIRVSLARFPLTRSLCTSLSVQPDTLDYSVRAYSLSAKSVRCQYLAEYWQSMSPFHYFLYLTNVFLLIFHTVPHMITYPMASNVSSPKGFPYPYLLHFRVSHCLTRLRP